MRKFIALAGLVALAACGGKGDQQQAAADSLSRDLQLAPADSQAALNDQPAAGETPAPAPAPAADPAQPKPTTPAAPKPTPPAAPRPSTPAAPSYGGTLKTGAEIAGTASDTLHSRHNKVGDVFHMTTSADIKNDQGKVVIPAGSVVSFKVFRLEPAKSRSETDGRLRLTAVDVTINGKSYPVSGEANRTTVEHALEGQGVTAGGAARVAGGAAGGAVAGQVVGGKTGAIVGGIAGAAGGAVLANQTADRDVVVRPGMKVAFTITTDLVVTP